ncbi:MAG: single-stranded DNA-binding protein [Burkholderiaceae bacterium]|nr:single-stranded DNA-binding protein [Burkholderiaceae bacterium]MDP3139468.1 single-stranded DNA-binding protein [Burkholderiaceae bacterium]
MISIFASGFIAGKPELQLVGSKRIRKCEFAVCDIRRAHLNGDWHDVWERVTFVAWDDEAEKIASTLDKGFNVSCTGLQETHEWVDAAGAKRKVVKYKLTAWWIERKPRLATDRDAAPPSAAQQSGRRMPSSPAPQPGPAQDFERDFEGGGHERMPGANDVTRQSGGLLEM